MHSYQGFSGIIRTGLTGLLFGALYISTGSLILPMILHFLVDFSANFIFKPVNEMQEERINEESKL